MATAEQIKEAGHATKNEVMRLNEDNREQKVMLRDISGVLRKLDRQSIEMQTNQKIMLRQLTPRTRPNN
mgnify:CR=1 FL=1